jgi:hypothetical protein
VNLRKHASLIVTGLLAAGLLAYAYHDREGVSDEERFEREGDIFPAWRRDAVTQIEIAHDDETIRLEKHADDGGAGSWHLTSPRSELADYSAAENLLISLEHGRGMRKSTAPPQSLEKPRARGNISMGAVSYSFLLGAPAPQPEGASYFQLQGGDAIVVSKEFTEALMQKSERFRSKNVVPYLSIQLDSMEIASAPGTWKLTRMSPIAFKIEPLGVRASRAKLDKIWGALSELRAEFFVPDAEAKAATERAPIRIAMKATDATRPAAAMRLGGECAGHPDDVMFYREAPDPVGACVPKVVLSALGMKPEDLADDGAFTARFDEVEEVKLTNEGGGDEKAPKTVELARTGAGFHMRAPQDRLLGPDEARSIAHVLELLDKCPGAHVTPGATANGPVLGRVHVRAQSGDEEIEVGRTFFRRTMDGAVVEAPRTLTAAILPRATLFRPPPAFDESVADERVDALELRCGGLTQSFARDSRGAFGAHAPQELVADQAGVAGLADTVARLRAEEWVSDTDVDGAFGTKDSTCSATIVSRAEAATITHTLRLGGTTEGGVYARADDDPNVMVLGSAASDLLHAVYMDLDTARPHGAVSRIVLRHADKAIELSRGDENAAVFDEADMLEFERAVRFGPAAKEEGLDTPWLTIELEARADGGAPSRKRISLGERPGKAIYARVDRVPVTYTISPGRVASLVSAAGPILSPAVLAPKDASAE